MEGVRPQRYAAGMHPFGAPDSAGECPLSHLQIHTLMASYNVQKEIAGIHISQGSWWARGYSDEHLFGAP